MEARSRRGDTVKLRLARKISKNITATGIWPRKTTAARGRARLTRRILSHFIRINAGRTITPGADKRDPLCPACGTRRHMHEGGACPP